MLRTASTAILILAGSALVLCLTLRLVVSAVFALSGIRRRAAHTQLLSW